MHFDVYKIAYLWLVITNGIKFKIFERIWGIFCFILQWVAIIEGEIVKKNGAKWKWLQKVLYNWAGNLIFGEQGDDL